MAVLEIRNNPAQTGRQLGEKARRAFYILKPANPGQVLDWIRRARAREFDWRGSFNLIYGSPNQERWI